MERIRVPSYTLNGRVVIASLRSLAREKLAQLCVNHLKRIKYVTPAFSAPLEFRMSSSGRGKAISRLLKVIYRNAVKANPAIAHALSLDGKDLVQLSGSSDLQITGVVYDRADLEILNRYFRYLGYLCNKYGIPLLFMDMREGSEADGQTTTSFSAFFMLAFNIPNELQYGTLTQESYDLWMSQRRQTLAANGVNPDAIYTQSYEDTFRRIQLGGHLNSLASVDSRNNGVNGSMLHKIGRPEDLVLNAESFSTVITTLSRKIAYGASAFSVPA